MKLIDKDRIAAEIERLKGQLVRGACASQVSMETNCKVEAYNEVLSFLDAIEVKEVDLEKEIKNGISNLSNLYCYMEDLFNGKEEEGVYPIPEKVTNELFEFAKHFFELGIKAKEENEKKYIGYVGGTSTTTTK